MREAARVILDRRITRFSQVESGAETGATHNDTTSVKNTSADQIEEELVPLPPEAR